jgi:D-glycero-D-manno-heptose 1,7-bisphosphate phosphatase
MKRKAVFLDKDGTLVENVPYNIDPDKITFAPYVVEGLQLLQSNGYLLVVVSNQPGIAHGYFSIPELENANEALKVMSQKLGIYLDGFYYCPHDPLGTVEEFSINCVCHKPQPGLISKAAKDLSIDISKSWMIGDILNDVEAGNRAGCKSILINNGNETEWLPGPDRVPEYSVKDFREAARLIVAANKGMSDGKTLERKKKYPVYQARQYGRRTDVVAGDQSA